VHAVLIAVQMPTDWVGDARVSRADGQTKVAVLVGLHEAVQRLPLESKQRRDARTDQLVCCWQLALAESRKEFDRDLPRARRGMLTPSIDTDLPRGKREKPRVVDP
jgi:hypothetical protein